MTARQMHPKTIGKEYRRQLWRYFVLIMFMFRQEARETGQTVCKPGSVPARRSVREMAIHLGRPSPDASRNPPGPRCGNPPADLRPRAVPIRSCSRWGLPCRRRCRRRGALLPHPFTLAGPEGQAVCSLWHFPWGRPRRPLAGTVFPWSPDFPHPLRSAAIRPSDPRR